MPGGRSGPVRPHKRFTLSRDRLKISNGSIAGLLFGLAFSSSGIFVLGLTFWMLLAAVGIVPPLDDQPRSMGATIGGVLVLLLLGLGHMAGGTSLLWTLRTTLDRGRDCVTVRSGWLGVRRQQRRLSEFTMVSVMPDTQFPQISRRDLWFDIALVDGQDNSLVIG